MEKSVHRVVQYPSIVLDYILQESIKENPSESKGSQSQWQCIEIIMAYYSRGTWQYSEISNTRDRQRHNAEG